MKRFVTSGYVKAGEVHLRNTRKLEQEFRSWRNCSLVVTFEKLYATRSLPANDYMWAVLIPRIQKVFKDRGITAGDDPVVTHEVLKSQFMDPELVRTGRIRGYISEGGLMIGTHTPDLTTVEFFEYLERICYHAAEYWDCYVPPPDKNWREKAEAETAARAEVTETSDDHDESGVESNGATKC